MTVSGVTGFTVGDWLDAFDPEANALRISQEIEKKKKWDELRLRRLHGLQIAVDVVAHTHAVPLRLLRLENLVELDKTFVRFVAKWKDEIISLLSEQYADGSPRVPAPMDRDAAQTLVQALLEPKHLHTLCNWVLRLANPDEGETDELLQRPPDLPEGYADWFLMLLPHVERDVWLTEMSNAMPVHTLARMVEHWSLYILMWVWTNAHIFQDADGSVSTNALGLTHLGLIAQPAFKRRGNDRAEIGIVLVAGPFMLDSAADEDDRRRYVSRIRTYLGRIERIEGVQGWQEVRDKAPGPTELLDALEARSGMDPGEAKSRVAESLAALEQLLSARMDGSLFEWAEGAPGRPLSRANWETMAVLAAWHARRGARLKDQLAATAKSILVVGITRHRVSSVINLRGETPTLTFLAYADKRVHYPGLPARHEWAELKEIAVGAHGASAPHHVATPANLHARLRVRRQAAWTAHVAAIHHLLSRHSPRDRPEGADDPWARARLAPTCEEADHLLRGFGGRIGRYLLNMTSADVVVVYWLDYSNDPPRLRHVAGAERLIQHRATRQRMLTEFDAKIWEPTCPDGSAALRKGVVLARRFQFYRAAAAAQVMPKPEDRKAKARISISDYKPQGELDIFVDPKPFDAVSVPLLYNDRVVGVFGVAGIGCERHFDLRLYSPLRLVAQVLAQAMYFNVQLWQMRQINWLASHVPLEEWRRHDAENQYNPLLRVARCLANVFLCPGMQIWLVDKQNPKRFQLHGNTAPEMFLDDKGDPGEHPPYLRVTPASGEPEEKLTRNFLAFAVDQYACASAGRAGNQWEGSHVCRSHRPGRYVQAVYTGGDQPTRGYNLIGAERGDLQLRRDWLRALPASPTHGGDALPTLRKAIFDDRRWQQTMGFALIGGEAHAPKVVGVVGAYSDGVDDDEPRCAWPPGWHQVVAHVQTYLPYVLEQTEIIANPLYELRRYLLHEGRNELNSIAVANSVLRNQLERIVAIDKPGFVRPWLREWLPRVKREAALSAATLLPGLEQLEHMLEEVARHIGPQLSIETAESIALLARLIERQRDMASLGVDFALAGRVHDAHWLSLRQTFWDMFSSYHRLLKERRVWWSVDAIDARVQLLSQPTLWRWLVGDLVHNVVKYAKTDSGTEVKLLEQGGLEFVLVLRNESSFDAELDDAERLTLYGVQGSAGTRQRDAIPNLSHVNRGAGTGIGLWGVDRLAKVLGLSFRVRIVEQKNASGQANYYFELTIPRRLIQSH